METYRLFNSVKGLNEQRAVFFEKNIKSINTKEDPYRIIFFPKNKGSKLNLDDPVTRQCNGYILSVDGSGNTRPVVIPSQLLSYNINYSFVNDNMNLYDIFNIQDGTTINLYWWEPLNAWRISTSKGYDVTELSWNGTKSYQSVFHSILNDELKIAPDDFYRKLDKFRCYTFGFNHKDYHPFCQDNGNIWFIQSVDLNLSNQEPLFQVSYISPIDTIPRQNQPNYTINELKDEEIKKSRTVQSLKKLCDDALDNYKKDSTKINFGYILRSREPDITKKYTNLIIESNLLRKIRNLCYDNYFKQEAQLNGFDREKYMILYNYVNSATRSIFKLLFPYYNNTIKEIEEKIQIIINAVIKEYQNKNSTFYQRNNESSTLNKEYLNYIITYINSNIDINIDNSVHVQYINQVVRSLPMIKVLYNLIFEDSDEAFQK